MQELQTDRAQLVWGAVQCGGQETQDWNGELGAANASSAPRARPACLQAPRFRSWAQKEPHKEGMEHALFPNTIKHPILEMSARLLRIDTRKIWGTFTVWFLLESCLRNNHFWANHISMHCHHSNLFYNYPYQRLLKGYFRAYDSISQVISFFQVQFHSRLQFWKHAF